MSAASLYKAARKSLDGSDYETAVRQYEALTARYPFSDQARQARLDLIYAYYRKGETESATDAAKQFLDENPTHPRVDYAWYMRGLIDFEHTPWSIERWFGVGHGQAPADRAALFDHRLQHRRQGLSEERIRPRRTAPSDLPAQTAWRNTRSTSPATTSAAAPTWPPRSAHSVRSNNTTARPRSRKRSRS